MYKKSAFIRASIFVAVALISVSSSALCDKVHFQRETISVGGALSPIIFHSTTGAKWNSLDYVGKKPVRIILIGATPHIETTQDNQTTIETAIAQAVHQMQENGVEVVTVIQPQFFSHGEAAKSSEFLHRAEEMNLQYADDTVYKQFSASPNGITLISIDMAGFLRQVEKLPVSSDISAAIVRSAKHQPLGELGKVAPDFSVMTEDQRSWRLADFRGRKKVLLLFMPAEMTCGCQNPIPSLQAKQSDIDKHDVEVLIISSNKETTNNLISSSTTRFDFTTDSGLNLHYLYYGDKDQDITEALAVLIDENGIVRSITKGSDPANFESDVVDKIISLNQK